MEPPPDPDWRSPDGSQLLLSSHGYRYLVTLSSYPRPTAPAGTAMARLLAAEEPVGPAVIADHRRYGSDRSFLLDMQGIDSFLYGRATQFRDETARQATLALGLTDAGTDYLRVGAAGAPPTGQHPGGEVLECSLLDGARLAGWSTSVSGFLPTGSDHSTATPLAVPPGTDLLDGRSIYSHTAFLARHQEPAGMHTIVLRVPGSDGGTDALDAVSQFAAANRIRAYAVRLFVGKTAAGGDQGRVVGRVLRRVPRQPIRDLTEAADIASEQRFALRPGQQLHCFGTHYRRTEPDWERFRGGRPYERRGHLHMMVTGSPVDTDQHEVSHLRELTVGTGTDCRALVTPVTRSARVDPVVRRGRRLVSRSSGRVLAEVPDGVR